MQGVPIPGQLGEGADVGVTDLALATVELPAWPEFLEMQPHGPDLPSPALSMSLYTRPYS